MENIHETIVKLKTDNISIAMDITRINVGLMSRIKDSNGVNIVLIEHNME